MKMRTRKAIPAMIIIALAAILFVVRQFRNLPASTSRAPAKKETRKNSGNVNRDRGFDRRISYLEYSEHAKCRMKCRKITRAEVEEIMQEGKINYKKSELQTSRCPRYAVEGITEDNQRVRIVYAQCNEFTNVVTVIDLNTDWPCDCPGDDKKYENRN